MSHGLPFWNSMRWCAVDAEGRSKSSSISDGPWWLMVDMG
jgi:hypothetical protein